MPDTGNGATLTRSGFTVDIVSMSLGNRTMEAIDISLLSDSTWMQKISADLADAGTLTVEYNFDAEGASGELLTPGGAAVSTTVTFPIHTFGNTQAATLAGTTLCTDVKPPDFANNELQRASATFTFDGVTGPTFTAET